MKYIKLFKESANFEKSKDKIERVFENENWLIVKPKTYKAFCYWGQNTEWSAADGNHQYYFNEGYTYINIKKETPLFPEMESKFYFNFYSGDFYDKDDNDIYLKDFFEENTDLFNFYGQHLKCDNIVEDMGDYWIICEEYSYFADFFRLGRSTRNDLIKKVLVGDSFDIFQYNSTDFNIRDCDIDLKEDQLLILKIALRLEKDADSEIEYDINDIKNYDDIVEVVKDNNLESIERAIQGAIAEGQEGADANAAYNDITDEIYKFFGLEMGSATWKQTTGYKNFALWIKFKTKGDAYHAKFIINKYDDSYEDDVIKYSPPYNGYYGESKDVEEGFNECIFDKLEWGYDAYSNNITYSQIDDYYKQWKKTKELNPDYTDDEIAKDVQFLLDAKRYNL